MRNCIAFCRLARSFNVLGSNLIHHVRRTYHCPPSCHHHFGIILIFTFLLYYSCSCYYSYSCYCFLLALPLALPASLSLFSTSSSFASCSVSAFCSTFSSRSSAPPHRGPRRHTPVLHAPCRPHLHPRPSFILSLFLFPASPFLVLFLLTRRPLPPLLFLHTASSSSFCGFSSSYSSAGQLNHVIRVRHVVCR